MLIHVPNTRKYVADDNECSTEDCKSVIIISFVNHSVYLLRYLDILLHTARVRTKTRDRGKWLYACMQCGAVVVCHGGQLTGAAAAAHLLLHVVIYIYIYIVRMYIILTRGTRAPTIHSAVCVRVYNNIYAVRCSTVQCSRFSATTARICIPTG